MVRHKRHAADHGGSPGSAQSRPTPPPARGPKVLVLGGTSDGFAAAESLVAMGCEVITSFAGVTETRRQPMGYVRVGGFGGRSGLGAYLAVEDIALVIDATHPFARNIKTNAAAAGADVGVPVIHVLRPAWIREPGDDWRVAPDLVSAAALTPATAGPCFLTVGRMKIAPFASRKDLRFVIRTVEPPSPPFDHPATTLIADRGPFTIEAERALFETHGFGCMVTANSGGDGASAKLEIARELGLPVVVVDRPRPPTGLVVPSVAEALEHAGALLGRAAA